MKDIMLDIETLGNKPGCIILAIGAVKFDLQTGALGESFFARISMADSISKRFKNEGATMDWWQQQDPELREYMFTGKEKIFDVFKKFWKYSYGCNVWGNGIMFDNAIMRHTYEKLGFKQNPWHYRNDRDLRTIIDLALNQLGIPCWQPGEDEKGLKQHHPLHDAIKQVKYLCYYFNNIVKLRRRNARA